MPEIEGILEEAKGIESYVRDLKIIINNNDGQVTLYKGEWTPKDTENPIYQLENIEKNIGKKVEVIYENMIGRRRDYFFDNIWYLIKKIQGKNKKVGPVPRIHKEIKGINFLTETL